MNIGKFIGNVETNLAHSATVRHENNIDKFFKIHDSDTFGDSFNQMYLAREIISRFAQRNGVKVDVYDAKKMTNHKALGTELSDKINLVVTNLHNGKNQSRIVAADTDKIYPNIKATNYAARIRTHKDGDMLTFVPKERWATEDTFLRNLYRNIEAMVTEVTKKSEK